MKFGRWVADLQSKVVIACLFATSPVWIFGCGTSKEGLDTESTAAASRIQFVDLASQAGVDAIYRNGEELAVRSIVESLGGGVAVFDFDRDGELDLYFPLGGSIDDSLIPEGGPGVLFRQNGPLEFERVPEAVVRCRRLRYSHGAACSDFDHDGFSDLLITGYAGLTLLKNNGDGTFRDVSNESGLADSSWSSSAGWGDVSGDGNPDLYVAHYVDWSPTNHPACRGNAPDGRDVCAPRRFLGLSDTLFISQGDGTFVDGSIAAGLEPEGKGLGVLVADLDSDHDLDVYVANDTVKNFFYENDGHGRMSEKAMFCGTSVDHAGNANGSMGLVLFDPNGDGRQDLWVTNYEAELLALYIAVDDDQFLHESTEWGLNRLDSLFVSFGTVAGDFDLDGDEDVAVANGHVILFPVNAPLRQVPLLFENQTDRLVRVPASDQPLLNEPRRGRGLAMGDLNRDGLPDLIFSNVNEPCQVAINRSTSTGNALSLTLVGIQSARVPIGAKVFLRVGHTLSVRQLVGGGSYLSSSDTTLHFGIGEAFEGDEVILEVWWPSGIRKRISINPGSLWTDQSHHLQMTLVEQESDK